MAVSFMEVAFGRAQASFCGSGHHFSIRAAGMLVGLILGGVVFQVGGYPAPGVSTSALTFVTLLLTLKLEFGRA